MNQLNSDELLWCIRLQSLPDKPTICLKTVTPAENLNFNPNVTQM